MTEALTKKGLKYGSQLHKNKRKYLRAVYDTDQIDVLVEAAAWKNEDPSLLAGPSKRRKTAMDQDVTSTHNAIFMEVPSQREVHALYRQFYERTSNSSVKLVVCAVCGRERTRHEWQPTLYPFPNIPNSHRLRPAVDWRGPDDAKVHGLLLSKAGCRIATTQAESQASICEECSVDLKAEPREGQAELPPKYSLANNLWYGELPDELDNLTLPERLLIGLAYPRAYVVKLYPKSGRYKSESHNISLSGNVTAFDLNIARIADMIEGNIMPRKPKILASLVSLTFVGVQRITKEALKKTFVVRRTRVKAALRWLKDNSPYYEDIDISDEALDELPDDDIPDEIWDMKSVEASKEALEKERSSYLPTDEDDLETEGKFELSHRQ